MDSRYQLVGIIVLGRCTTKVFQVETEIRIPGVATVNAMQREMQSNRDNQYLEGKEASLPG